MRAIHAVRELNEERDEPIRADRALHGDRAPRAVRAPGRRALLPRPGHGRRRRGRRKSAYLDYDRLERALTETRADAAWVGWGFVAEHPAFAELCDRLGIVFVGPEADVMRALGDKIEAKKLAEEAGVPVAPWSGGPVESVEDASEHGEALGFPLMIKAAAGGGGRGMRRVNVPGRARERVRARAHRGRAGLRRPERADRAHRRGRAPRRGAADRRRPGRRVGARRARLLLPAPPPEGRRGVRQPRSHPRAGVGARDRRRAPRGVGRLPRRGHGRVPLRAGGRALRVHGGQHAAAGRASRDRGGHRRRPRASCSSTSPPAGGSRATRRRRTATRSRCASTPRTRAWGSRPAPGRISLLRLPDRAGHPRRQRRGRGRQRAARVRLDDRQDHRPRRTRDEAIARLRRAVADTMVVIEEGATNQGFLLELLGRPELRAGEVDTGWLDRLQAAGRRAARGATPTPRSCRPRSRSATRPPPPTRRTSTRSRAAAARRPRPRSAARSTCAPRLELPPGRSARSRPTRYLVEIDGARIEAHGRAADRARAAAVVRRRLLPHGDLAARDRRAGRGQRRAAPDLARRGRPRAQPCARRRRRHHRGRRRRGAGRRRRRRHRVDEDGDVADRARRRPRARRCSWRANVQVGPGRPLLQIEPLEDAPDESAGERIDVRRRRRARCTDGLERLRWLVLGYDVPPDEVSAALREVLAGAGRPRRRAAPARGLRRRARARRARTPRTSAERPSCSAARRSTCTPSCARSTRRPRACPTASSSTWSGRSPTTASRAWSARRRCSTPPTACSSPSSAPSRPARRCAAVLSRHLERAGELSGEVLPRRARPARDRRSRRASPRSPSWRASCAGAPATSRCVEAAAARRPTRRCRSTSRRWPRQPEPRGPRRAHTPRSSTARSRSLRCSTGSSATPARWSRR